MGTSGRECSFCDRAGAFGPHQGVRLCEACARRVGTLARSGHRELVEVLWPIVRYPSKLVVPSAGTGEVTAIDPEAHLNLAIAYREMGLDTDAVQEAGLVVEHTADIELLRQALTLLLTPPLLRPRAIRRLRPLLTMN